MKKDNKNKALEHTKVGKKDRGNSEFKESADRLLGKDTFAQFRSFKKNKSK